MVTSSDTKINVNLKLPTKWEDLNNPLTFGKKKTRFSFCSHSTADLADEELRYLFGLLAQNFPAQQVKTYCLFRWSGMQVMHRYGKGWWCKFAKDEFVIMADQINAAIASLDWLDTLPSLPIRLAKIGSHRAIDAQFQGVPFETFIVCDNLYQGYLATRQDNLLDELATHLYQTQRIKLTAAERISIFYWFASLKAFFTKVFKHFFQPIDNASGDNGNMFEQQQSQFELLQNAVNAQIRALTKGDITKEQQVLSLDTWRALTELDAQAREYEELNAKYPTK